MRYTYQIFAQNIGGERVKGTIPTKVAEWWLEKYPDLFQSYFMHEGKTHDEEDDWGHIPEEYQLGDFNEIDDLFHADAPILADGQYIEIHADNDKDVIKFELKKLKSKHNREQTNNSNELTIVYGQKFYQGVWDYELTLDHKFVASKLIVITKSWGSEKVVIGFEHEGERAKYIGTDSQHIGTTRAWIDN